MRDTKDHCHCFLCSDFKGKIIKGFFSSKFQMCNHWERDIPSDIFSILQANSSFQISLSLSLSLGFPFLFLLFMITLSRAFLLKSGASISFFVSASWWYTLIRFRIFDSNGRRSSLIDIVFLQIGADSCDWRWLCRGQSRRGRCVENYCHSSIRCWNFESDWKGFQFRDLLACCVVYVWFITSSGIV